MKLKLQIIIVGLLCLSPALALAVSPSQGGYGLNKAATAANYDTSSGTDVFSMSQTVINGLLALVGFVFFGYFVYAGLRWLTAQGNKAAIEKAKSTMISTIIGIVIISGAYALTNFVFNALSK